MDATTRAELETLAALHEKPAQQMTADDWRFYDLLRTKYAAVLVEFLADHARIGELANDAIAKAKGDD